MENVGQCSAPPSTSNGLENGGSEWNVLYWILGLICMPLALPFVVLSVWRRYRADKYRNSMPGRVVLITGASSGLGEALAHVFYKAGCKLILAARRLDELERVRGDLIRSEANGIVFPPTVMLLDLAELNDIPDFVEKALVYKQIDVLINNGGISVRADALSSDISVDIQVMVVNYFGAVALTKAVLPSMLKHRTGHICFVSSVQGKIALPQRSAYSASKHALQAFSDSLRAEVAAHGIRVTCVSPGYIRTQLSVNALTGDGEIYGKMDETTKAGMDPHEMAALVFKAILREEKDKVICGFQPKAAIYLRLLFPSLYFWMMEKRVAAHNSKQHQE